MEKINVAELIKDCPSGMELDSTLLEGLEFDSIVDSDYLPIRCRIKNPNGGYNVYNFTKHGCWFDSAFAKCLIFPKGKTTWEGFHRPFVEGDIVSTKNGIYVGIVKFPKDNHCCHVFCSINDNGDFVINNNRFFSRFATEEEKQKLFDAIKANGYKWNAETKTLEKLPKFKVGDRIRHKDDKTVITITGIKDGYYLMQFFNIRRHDYQNEKVLFEDQDRYELVPNKFDINTLVPFESKVLIRNVENQRWIPAFWGYKVVDGFITTFGWCKYCIPYKGNEHLLGTTNDCGAFYKTWE